jgi:hypothetical protein
MVVWALLVVSVPMAVRVLADPGSDAFLAERAAGYGAVAVALGAVWQRRGSGPGGWRVVLLPLAAVAFYRAAWEILRIVQPNPPLWFLGLGLALALWVLTAGARGAIRELRAGAAAAAP